MDIILYPVNVNDTISRVNHQYQLDVTIGGTVFLCNDTKRPAIMDAIISQKNQHGGFGPPANDTQPLIPAC